MQVENKITEACRAVKMNYEVRAREDLILAVKTYTELKPCTIQHLFPDGETRLCVALNGTIPVNYRGSIYHIPIALYFMENHPYRGPICYVKPTSTMQIRQSETVDTKGRVYLPYLTEWRYPGYDTYGLLQVMQIAFQEKCPVYSIASNRNVPYSVGNNAMPSSYITPMPNNFSSNTGYQPPYQPYMASSNQAKISPIPSPNLQNSSTNYSNYNTIQTSHIRASLITAIEEKIRSRLFDKIGTPFAELQSVDINLQELRTGQQKLREMLEKMEKEQKQLDGIVATLQEKKTELEKALQTSTIPMTLQEESEGNLAIDRAIDTTTPLYRQIFRNYVLDCCVDDSIYFLGKALKNGNINLQVYMKYVRQLSQKQFKYRATVQKCRQRARLPI